MGILPLHGGRAVRGLCHRRRLRVLVHLVRLVGVYELTGSYGLHSGLLLSLYGSPPSPLRRYDWSEYGHPLVSYTQLSNWGKCPDFGADPSYYGVYSPSFATWAKNGGLDLSSDPCKYMTGKGKDTASTMSLSVLVTIEMFNAGSASRDIPDPIT